MFCFGILYLLSNISYGQALPNHEFRGIWVATVGNLDWPVQGATPESQKAALRTLLDKIKAAKLNTVFFQVRAESDAFYNSTKEPWSRFITGTQGVDPGYDPLAFAIEEAHARGLELHAWINPFRVNYSTSSSIYYAENHVSKSKPGWLLRYSTNKMILDPGIPDVRSYIASVVQEIVKNYAVDGIHFDDYFYPYPGTNFNGITTEDSQTFTQYGAGYTDIKEWRRNNVNETIRLVSETIKATRPEVRFGVSPFGIWKNGTPSGISGMDAYNVVYADPLNWLQNQYVDYLSPQLYWRIGGAQDYTKLLEWWSDKAYTSSRHLYAGHAIYQTTYTEQEVTNQIAVSRTNRNKNALGDVLFRASNLTGNTINIFSQLRANTYKYPAAPPAMAWKNASQPEAPQTLAIQINEATGNYEVTWQRNAANTDPFKRYVLYTSANPITSFSDIADGSVRALQGTENFSLPAAEVPQQTSYWVVTELNNVNAESGLSNVVTLNGVTGIKKLAKESILKVYPNPATTILYADIDVKKSSYVKAELVSMDGRVRTRIAQKRFEAGTHTLTINREKLKPGVYALIVTLDKQRVVRKVILR